MKSTDESELREEIKEKVLVHKKRIQYQVHDSSPSVAKNPAPTSSPPSSLHIHDLLSYHDESFITHAFQALLLRQPDSEGMLYYLSKLRNGTMSKLQIIHELMESGEGVNRSSEIAGLQKMLKREQIKSIFIDKIPGIRYIFKIIYGWIRYPKERAYLDRLEKHYFALFTEQSHVNTSYMERIEVLTNEVHMLCADLADMNVRLQHNHHAGNQLADQQVRTEQQLNTFITEIQNERQAIKDEEEGVYNSFYVNFENVFRGNREEIKGRQAIYIDYIRGNGAGTADTPILDVACGRGEWLELLREHGFKAKGIDINASMIDLCETYNLDVEHSDVISFLESQESCTFGAITGFHIAEHLPFVKLIKLFDEALRVLKPGGMIIFETPNPENIVVGSCNFYIDPTHRNPLPPVLLQFLANERGFVGTEILRVHPMEFFASQASTNEIENRIARLFTNELDYSVIAFKA